MTSSQASGRVLAVLMRTLSVTSGYGGWVAPIRRKYWERGRRWGRCCPTVRSAPRRKPTFFRGPLPYVAGRRPHRPAVSDRRHEYVGTVIPKSADRWQNSQNPRRFEVADAVRRNYENEERDRIAPPGYTHQLLAYPVQTDLVDEIPRSSLDLPVVLGVGKKEVVRGRHLARRH